MKASVIIATYRRFGPLLDTVRDLLRQEGDFEVIVVDQNPAWPDDLAAAWTAVQADPRVSSLRQEEPGVVRARNAGVARSTGDILIFVDDDVAIPGTDFVRKHLANYADASVHMVVGRECRPGHPPPEPIGPRDGERERLDAVLRLPPVLQAFRFDRDGNVRSGVCTFSTCNGSVRRDTFLSAGGFDEKFGGNSYGDDYDLALRLHAAGRTIVYDPTLWLFHLRVPAGGLRMTDQRNRIRRLPTYRGLWQLVLRHGTLMTAGPLAYRHVLRKTVLLRDNVRRPWRQVMILPALATAFVLAWAGGRNTVRSPFPKAEEP